MQLGDDIAVKTRRYLLGDPSLIDLSGHCLEYLASLATPLSARGYEVQILGNRGMRSELANRLSATGVFTYWCDARPVPAGIDPTSAVGRRLVRREHEMAVKADLTGLDTNVRFNKDDVLVLNTFRHWALRGIVDWLESLGRCRAPHVVLILHFTAFPIPGVDNGSSRMYREAFARIENSPLRDRFIVMADAQGLVTEYSFLSKLDFLLAPIPHSARESSQAKPPCSPHMLKFTYVGEARINKGFHLLPWVVNRMLAGPYRDKVQFCIQSFCHEKTSDFYNRTMAKFPSAHVTFFPDQLSEEEYQSFLDTADVVLVPYLLDNYHVQTSGIYAEAAGMGKPVIVPRGSWMALQVKEYGGGLTFPPGDAQGLLDACNAMVENYDRLAAEARIAADKWRDFHNAYNLADLIEAAVEKCAR